MRTRLLRPSWLLLHVLIALLMYGMYRLGGWQWGRGHQTGSIRNYSYGLEWWAFVVLTLAGWVKYCIDETADGAPANGAVGDGAVGDGAVAGGAVADGEVVVRAPALPVAVAVSAEDDPDLAAWNATFAELARRDAERSS